MTVGHGATPAVSPKQGSPALPVARQLLLDATPRLLTLLYELGSTNKLKRVPCRGIIWNEEACIRLILHAVEELRVLRTPADSLQS